MDVNVPTVPTNEIVKVFEYQDYGVYIYDETGGWHHGAHCHVRRDSRDVANVRFDAGIAIVHGTVPRTLYDALLQRRPDLIAVWNRLNPERRID